MDALEERRYVKEQAFEEGRKAGLSGKLMEDAFDGGCTYCIDREKLMDRILCYEYEFGYADGRMSYLEDKTGNGEDVADVAVRRILEKKAFVEPARKLGSKAYRNGYSKTAVLNEEVYNLLPGSNHPTNKLIYDEWEDAYNEAELDPNVKPYYMAVMDTMNAQFLKDFYDEEVDAENDAEKEALQSYRYIIKLLEGTGDERMIKCLTCHVLYTGRLNDIDKTADIEIVNCEEDCAECLDYLNTAAKWHLDVIRQFLYHREE